MACLLAAGCCAVSGAVIYEVPEDSGEVVGAWDVNILADDVHFETTSIIHMVRMRLAIAGVQTCQLWLFTTLNSPPIYVATFTNRPATNQFDVSTYDFPMQVLVPRDIYIGFSAQAGGWSVNGVDYWSRGTTVSQGVAGTPGQYYYGPVSGERLTASYSPADGSFGCMQILSEPVHLDAIAVDDEEVQLAISSMPIHAANIVEMSGAPGGTNWVELATLPPGLSNHVWSATTPGTNRAFYRVKSR